MRVLLILLALGVASTWLMAKCCEPTMVVTDERVVIRKPVPFRFIASLMAAVLLGAGCLTVLVGFGDNNPGVGVFGVVFTALAVGSFITVHQPVIVMDRRDDSVSCNGARVGTLSELRGVEAKAPFEPDDVERLVLIFDDAAAGKQNTDVCGETSVRQTMEVIETFLRRRM